MGNTLFFITCEILKSYEEKQDIVAKKRKEQITVDIRDRLHNHHVLGNITRGLFNHDQSNKKKAKTMFEIDRKLMPSTTREKALIYDMVFSEYVENIKTDKFITSKTLEDFQLKREEFNLKDIQ